jgi:hypothetical protein
MTEAEMFQALAKPRWFDDQRWPEISRRMQAGKAPTSGLVVRFSNAMRHSPYWNMTLEQLRAVPQADLLRMPNCGRKSVNAFHSAYDTTLLGDH